MGSGSRVPVPKSCCWMPALAEGLAGPNHHASVTRGMFPMAPGCFVKWESLEVLKWPVAYSNILAAPESYTSLGSLG